MYQNLTMEEALENEEFAKIINRASSKYRKYIDEHELKSLQMEVLWKCLNKYNPEHKMKFVTYLYTQIGYAIKNLIKKNKRVDRTYDFDIDKTCHDNKEVQVILGSLKEADRKILEQRFFSRMTVKEIGDANGYSKETARRKIQQALNKCRLMYKICVFS